MAKTTYRKHGGLPAYFQHRDGRPAWIPSQGLRDAGWKRCDLKDADGRYLSLGAAIDRAAVINDAVGQWRQGFPVPAEHAAFAPAGSCADRPVIRRAEAPTSIGALIDAWAGVKAPPHANTPTRLLVEPSNEFARLAASTQRDYRNKILRLVEVLAGWPEGLPIDADDDVRAAYAADIADIRAASIFQLEPVEDAAEARVTALLYDAYWILRRRAGPNMANGVLTVAGVWLNWIRKHRTRAVHNWASEVDRVGVPGRIRVLTWPELRAMVATAERMGWPSIADSIVLGVDLTWSQADRLALTWNRIVNGGDGRLRAITRSQLTDGPTAERLGRQKTGRIGGTPFLDLGLKRITLIQARQKAMAAQPTHVIWCETTGAPWKPDHYRHVYAEIRAQATRIVASVADHKDQDLRDTGITFCRRAGLTIDETCARSLQSRKRVLDLWDQAYGEIGEEIADAGADKMNAWIAGQKGAL